MSTDLLNSSSTVNSNVLANATTTNSKTSASASQNQLSSDINFFLTMLTTQLKNQDPTAPLDTNQFTQQIAQYSSVQQQVITNDNLEKLLSSNRQSSITTAVGYIGKEVETVGSTGEVVGGQGAFSYILPRAATSVEIEIKNKFGQVMFKGAGDMKEGRNLVVWDGVNSTTGKREPDGSYTISVVAKDASNKEMTVETRAVGIVGGVETDKDGNPMLTAGSRKISFDQVLAVREPTRADLSG
jgi:flagellar basal-body rod modification protein FlgD